MKLYNVEVVETLSRFVEQQANSYEESQKLLSFAGTGFQDLGESC